MAVDDLWYLSKRGPHGEKVKSQRYGRGKRWRCRYEDAGGNTRTRFFDRKVDADAWDKKASSGTAEETQVDQSARRTTFHDYAERWRLSRQIGQALDYQRHIESRLRHHHYPYFGDRPIRAITVTDVLEWIARLLQNEVAQSSVKTYFDLLNNIMNSAMVDKVIPDNPCKSVRLFAILRGFSRAPKWVPTDDDVLVLVDVVPDEFLAAIWAGAGEGLRLGEVLGLEDSARCIDPDRQELHVVQQLRFHKSGYGGFYLAPPKAGSVGDVDLDDHVAAVFAEHVRTYPPVLVELPDVTTGTPDPGKDPKRRLVPLLFTDDQGRPIHDQRWSDMWQTWRKAAEWPDEGTFHSLRHYFATRLITSGADPTDVQNALRHSSLRITLETYVHWWPKKDRRRNIISSALQDARAKRPTGRKSQNLR
ncbi:tyrosine-type recombinase/integrase [Micromonospora sp. Llam7]|uniref:tyrosine-type recombinase/integrase n=1 Tax=Micromonospora tarapacensis TaxID=2835305 RepID=UPI001C837C41|nr:tyrosine-type recombinase/integrase [Micromonospora tarapacensis]MBX7269253.1 tyrosine-type recombinase/integrase [Micromonospora tarapacensis]